MCAKSLELGSSHKWYENHCSRNIMLLFCPIRDKHYIIYLTHGQGYALNGPNKTKCLILLRLQKNRQYQTLPWGNVNKHCRVRTILRPSKTSPRLYDVVRDCTHEWESPFTSGQWLVMKYYQKWNTLIDDELIMY